jgi:trk system potassium uptake protein
MTSPHPQPPSHASWLWATAFIALWLASAAALRQPWCLQPGHFLYVSDALLLTASAFTCSGLSPIPIQGQFTWPGICILAVLMQSGMAATLCLTGRLALKLFPVFTPDRTPIHPAIFRTGLRVIFVGQALLVLALLITPQGISVLPNALFDAISAISTTGVPLAATLSPGVQFTALGQAILIPIILLGALGAVPVGDAWRWAASRGQHTLHPISRRIWTSFALTFILGALLITAVLLAPYSYQLLHLGMESGASDLGTLSRSTVQDAIATGTFAAGPARLGAVQPIEPALALPSYQFIMIALSFIGVAPLSLAGGLSVLGLSTILGSGFSAWRKPAITPTPNLSVTTPLLTRWALATLTFYILIIATGFLILLISEPYPPMTLAAEAIAAASNAGFSLGITGDITAAGKAVLIALMILGRLGPLYLACNLILQPRAQTR